MNPSHTPTRLETDALGSLPLPAEADWGIHTARAVANFNFGQPMVWPEWIGSLIQVKQACAMANAELGYLTPTQMQAIQAACDAFLSGSQPIDAHYFPVESLQGGAGTSLNMNVNEVLANQAMLHLGGQRGVYTGQPWSLHPIEHLNLHQSTNDVVPTALKMAAINATRSLSDTLAKLQGQLQQLEQRDAGILKMGRTELQDAVPIALGAEWGAFAEAVARDRWRMFKAEERLRLVNLGGTAVGTGLTAPRAYIFRVMELLRQVSGLNLSRGETLMDTTANGDCYVEVCGMLNACASTLCKLSGDLRWMNHVGEIHLPSLQVGSSIMPGKVNPVSLEALMQACLKVFANTALVTQCVSRSTFQIIEFLPLLGHAFLESYRLLSTAVGMLTDTLAATQADEACCAASLARSPSIITALLPYIGYEVASGLVKAYHPQTHGNFRSYLVSQLGEAVVANALSAKQLLKLGFDTPPTSTCPPSTTEAPLP